MNLPVSPNSRDVTRRAPEGFSRAEAGRLARLTNAELAEGLVAATRVQAAATVAGIGVQTMGMLYREAEFQANGDPAAATRMNHVLDRFAMCVGNEISRFGR